MWNCGLYGTQRRWRILPASRVAGWPGLFPIVGQPTLKAAEAAKEKAEAAMEKAAAAQVEIELWEL